MNAASTLKHAAAELRYQRSALAQIDAAADRAKRARADAAMGHVIACTLTRCAAGCAKASK